MKRLFIFISSILTVIIALSSTACRGIQIMSFSAFSTTVRIEAHDKPISNSTQKELRALFSALEQEFDSDLQGSIINSFNISDINAPIILSEDGEKILSLAKQTYEFTDGKFDPTVSPLVKLWQFDDFGLRVSPFVPPTEEQIQTQLEKVDFNSVILDGNRLSKSKIQTQLDLGGLVKGYAVDKALEIMQKAGHSKGYINIGNSSMALLEVNTLNVSHPRDNGNTILSVNCKGEKNICLSSSGDYERFYEHQGKKYSHIIDPRTGKPIDTGIASATVLGCSGAFSDAITTALCICDRQNELIPLMKKIIAQYPDCEIYVVYEKDGDKQIITNKKQGDDFTLLDEEYKKDIIDINLI